MICLFLFIYLINNETEQKLANTTFVPLFFKKVPFWSKFVDFI